MSRDQPQDGELVELERRDQWWERPLVVIDTETTGTDPLTARIVQLSCLGIYPDGRVSPSSYEAIVNPGVPVPPEASAVHGITDERIALEGVPLADALYELLKRLDRWNRTAPVVIFNAVYDWPLLWAELDRTELCWTAPLGDARLLDPLLIERTFNGVRRGHYSHKLADVVARYRLAVPSDWAAGFHDARFDCQAAAAVLRAQVLEYDLLRKLPLAELQRRQRQWFANWRDELNLYWASKGKPQRVRGEWPFGPKVVSL